MITIVFLNCTGKLKKMNAHCFNLFLIVFLARITLQQSEGTSLDLERIKPDNVSDYLFKTDHINVLCKVSSEKKIEKIIWSLTTRYPSVNEKQSNNTDVEIINKWNSNKTGVESHLIVRNVPTSYPQFYYRCEAEFSDDEKWRHFQYNYIREKSVPKVNITESKIIQHGQVTPNQTVEVKYNSYLVLRCKLTFEANDKLNEEYVDVEMRKEGEILAERTKLKYEKADNVSLEYRINDAEVDDGGVYTCLSKMVLRQKTFVSSQYIKLTLPLRLTGPREKEVRSSLGDDVELDCDIEAFPTPKWTFEYGKSGVFVKSSLKQSGEPSDVRNDSNINIHGNLLKIQSVQNYNERVYTCIAVDEAGNTKTQNISLTIIDNDDDKNKCTGNKATRDSSLLIISVFLINFAWLVLE